MAGQLLHAIGRGRTLTRSASPHPQLGDCGESTSLSRGGSVAMQAIFLPVTPAWTAGDGMGGPSLPPFIGAHRRLSRESPSSPAPSWQKALSVSLQTNTGLLFLRLVFLFHSLFNNKLFFLTLPSGCARLSRVPASRILRLAHLSIVSPRVSMCPLCRRGVCASE